MKKYFILLLITFCMSAVSRLYAWGPDGHTIVVELAMQFVKPDVRQNVLAILDTMTLRTAGNWMDIMRSNSDYDFLKPWHYIDFPADRKYQPTTDENILNRIIITNNELRHKKVLCDAQVKADLLVLMHLMGDLHQPLHTGYPDDLGGNKVAIEYDTLNTNLHHFWDEDIIRYKKITLEDCLALYQTFPDGAVDTIQGIHPELWMNETRSLLDQVYLYQGLTPDSTYMNRSKLIIERQLLVAGLRLAAILNKLFYSPAPIIDMQEVAAKYKDGIDIKDVKRYVGKKVTICSRVYGIKSTNKVSLINLGDKYPNSLVTVVIFDKDRKKFDDTIDDLYTDKNICVEGTIDEYNGKLEIIIDNPNAIQIQ